MSVSVPKIARRVAMLVMMLGLAMLMPQVAWAGQAAERAGGEAALVVPDLSTVPFLGGIDGRTLLMGGLLVCALGLLFGLMTFTGLKNLPVHKSMLEVSELIYETC